MSKIKTTVRDHSFGTLSNSRARPYLCPFDWVSVRPVCIVAHWMAHRRSIRLDKRYTCLSHAFARTCQRPISQSVRGVAIEVQSQVILSWRLSLDKLTELTM